MPNWLTGTPERTQQFQLKNPLQQGLQNQSIGGAQDLIKRLSGGNQFDFAPIAQQAQTNFQTKTVPGLAERFTSQLGSSGQRSGAFRNAIGAAGAGLNENLASLQQQYNLQNRGFDQNLLGMLLGQGSQPSFENLFRPREAGFLENSANKLVDYLPTILGALFGIPLPPAGGGGQQQQGGGLFQLSGGLGGGNNGYGFGSENGFQFPNLAQQFGQTRFNNF